MKKISLKKYKDNISLELRKKIYFRDNFTCQYCGKKGIYIEYFPKGIWYYNGQVIDTDGYRCQPRVVEITNKPYLKNYIRKNKDCIVSFHIDHVIPESKGGQTVLENLKLACRECNVKKGSNDKNLQKFYIFLQCHG